jgi:hypothetical protein
VDQRLLVRILWLIFEEPGVADIRFFSWITLHFFCIEPALSQESYMGRAVEIMWRSRFACP